MEFYSRFPSHSQRIQSPLPWSTKSASHLLSPYSTILLYISTPVTLSSLLFLDHTRNSPTLGLFLYYLFSLPRIFFLKMPLWFSWLTLSCCLIKEAFSTPLQILYFLPLISSIPLYFFNNTVIDCFHRWPHSIVSPTPSALLQWDLVITTRQMVESISPPLQPVFTNKM